MCASPRKPKLLHKFRCRRRVRRFLSLDNCLGVSPEIVRIALGS
jgi:hypothetical protein